MADCADKLCLCLLNGVRLHDIDNSDKAIRLAVFTQWNMRNLHHQIHATAGQNGGWFRRRALTVTVLGGNAVFFLLVSLVVSLVISLLIGLLFGRRTRFLIDEV